MRCGVHTKTAQLQLLRLTEEGHYSPCGCF